MIATAEEVECKECFFYDKEDNVCLAMECFGTDCPPLPCESIEE